MGEGADLRVLHVVESGERRGAEVFTADLVRVLNGSDVTQHVAVVRGRPPFAAGYEATVTALDAGDGLPGVRVDAGSLLALRRLVRSWRPSLVQTHGGSTLKYGTLAAGDTPVVARIIGTAPPWARQGPRRAIHARLRRRATALVPVADVVAEELVGTFGIPRDRVRMIPNGVDPARLRPVRDRAAVREELNIARGAPVLVSIGALTWEKDPFAHVEVSRQLGDDVPGLVHLILGDGPMRAEVEAAASQPGLAGRIRVLGNRSDVADLLGASDVLLFASRSDGMEGMPAVVIEAGLAGLPVAGYAVAGVPDVVEDGVTGLLVGEGRVDELAGAAGRLLASAELRERLGAAARERCAPCFTIDTVGRAYLDLYASLAGARVAGGPA